MKFSNIDQDHLIVKLESGDDIMSEIQDACKRNNIENGEISGIGSVSNPTLAHYSKISRKFSETKLQGIYEVVSLLGNVFLQDKIIKVHLHTVVADDKLEVKAGHLVSGTCSATLELVITRINSTLDKVFDDEIGLKVWDISAN
ncbi:MAG: PPC domain-containing DNA-binding protein [Candidatus Saccharimonadia bacterium]